MEESKEVELLRVFAVVNTDTKESKYGWKFGGNFNAYTLIGLLESITFGLLKDLNDRATKEVTF
jgi:hypothetical protein